jgi:hypothetical protein
MLQLPNIPPGTPLGIYTIRVLLSDRPSAGQGPGGPMVV